MPSRAPTIGNYRMAIDQSDCRIFPKVTLTIDMCASPLSVCLCVPSLNLSDSVLRHWGNNCAPSRIWFSAVFAWTLVDDKYYSNHPRIHPRIQKSKNPRIQESGIGIGIGIGNRELKSGIRVKKSRNKNHVFHFFRVYIHKKQLKTTQLGGDLIFPCRRNWQSEANQYILFLNICARFEIFHMR